ncbi:hypothetical protein [Peribacillus sp. TH27]|uniref:hypothetical protein n=1 Tax=Peribacillus sp. TH27 TaxID=2798484 RepID=UPI001914D859|nr:hypothetical protein [Peribacillus sp. TH27]MBK5463456.1 hypothetical protein [Peribacillus sp. TH27]
MKFKEALDPPENLDATSNVRLNPENKSINHETSGGSTSDHSRQENIPSGSNATHSLQQDALQNVQPKSMNSYPNQEDVVQNIKPNKVNNNP